MNKPITLLTLSDIFTWGAYYSTLSIIGIYIAQKLGGSAVEYIGIGGGIYMIGRALWQFPVGYIADKIKSDRDEIIMLSIANLLMGIPFLIYPHLTSPLLFYVAQFLLGTGAGINLVNWRKLFAKNLDRNHEGSEYAMYEIVMSTATALMSFAAGYFANTSQTHFDNVVRAIGIIIISSTIWPALIITLRKRKSK